MLTQGCQNGQLLYSALILQKLQECMQSTVNTYIPMMSKRHTPVLSHLLFIIFKIIVSMPLILIFFFISYIIV